MAGGLAAWLVASDPGAGHGARGTLRGDVDALRERQASVDANVFAIGAQCDALAKRIAEATPSQDPQGTALAAAQVKALADDVKTLRDGVQRELAAVDQRLVDLRHRIDDAVSAPASREGPLSPEEEQRWSALARDADPGTRFSALVFLGRARTDRSAQVSIERLTTDEDPEVLRQALRNLGRFGEKSAATQVAEKLEHPEAVIRAAARDALVAMGAPKDTGFDPIATPQKRHAAADALRHWAESQ